MKLLRRYPMLLTVPVLFALWFVAARYGWIGQSLLASPSEVAATLRDAAHPPGADSAIFHHALATIGRALSGWSLALGIGVCAGLFLGLNELAYRAFEPVLEFVRAVPPIMAFPLLLVAFNFGQQAYVWTIAVGCLPVMLLTVARGVHAIDRSRLALLSLHGASAPLRCAASFMEILPSIFLGARLTFSISLIVSVVTEMVFSPRSGYALGALAKDAEISFDTPKFYACILVLGCFGFVVNAILRRAEWWLEGRNERFA